MNNIANSPFSSNTTLSPKPNSPKSLDYITVLRFPLMVLVVALHTKLWVDALLDKDTLSMARVVSELITSLTMLAVPTFFVISGFLFFRNMPTEGAIPTRLFIQKMKARFHSLFVPYMLWNAFVLVVKSLQYQLEGREWREFLSWESFFGGQPLNFPLWYVRNLMILCVLSPVIYMLLSSKLLRKLVMMVVLLNAVLLFLPGFFGVGAGSYFYFMLGAAVALNHSDLADFVRPIGRACVVLFFLFLSVKFILFAASMGVISLSIGSWMPPNVSEIFDTIYTLFGVIAVLYSASFYVTMKQQKQPNQTSVLSRRTQWLSASTFFILVFHTPLPSLFSEKLLTRILPFHNDLVFTLNMLLSILLNLAVCLVVYHFVLRLPHSWRKVILGHA